MSSLLAPTSDSHPLSSPALKRYLLDRVNRIAGLKNTRIVYFDGIQMHEVRPHPPICQQSYLTIVIRAVDAKDVAKIVHPTPHAKQEDGRFYSELLSTSLSCGAAALSWVVVGGSGAAIPFTGGTSTPITVIGYAAATASSFQCVNSFIRLTNESRYGSPEINRWLDSQAWYTHTSTALDVISVAGAAVAIGATLKMVLQLRKTGTPFKQILNGLSRQQRKQVTEEIIRTQNPGISNKALKALVAAGTYPKRFGKIELSNTVRLQLKEAVGATFSFMGSATGGVIRHPKAIPDLAIALFEEFEIY